VNLVLQDMATSRNTQAANFLMRQKMTGKALLGGLHSPIAVTQVPDDGEEFDETTTIQPEHVAREPGLHVADMGGDYEHTLQLEGDGFEVEHGNLDECEPDQEDDHGDMQQPDDKTLVPDDQPHEDELDDELQTLLQDDATVFPDETEDSQTQMPVDDPLQGHHFDGSGDGDDAVARDLWTDAEKRIQLPGIDMPIGARKKRRTA